MMKMAAFISTFTLLLLAHCGSGEIDIAIGDCAGQPGCIAATLPVSAETSSNDTVPLPDATAGAAAPVTVRFVADRLSLRENIGQAVVLVWLSAIAPADVTVQVLAGGTAQPGIDYTWSDPTVTIPQGEIVRSVIVPIIDNEQVDEGRTLQLFLSMPQGALLADPAALTMTIQDDENGTPSLLLPVNAARALAAANGSVDFGGGSCGLLLP